jgi:putative transposase
VRSAGTCGKAPGGGARPRSRTRPARPRADRIRRDVTADAGQLNARWCGDLTSIGTWEGWRYLATVIDLASRRVVGYALADHLRTKLVSAALANALAARDPDPGVTFHSDRGCPYTSRECAALAAGSGVTLSPGPHRPRLGQRPF